MAVVILKLSSDMIGADENNFHIIFYMTDRQVANLCKVFANFEGYKIIKYSVNQIIQLGRLHGRLLGPLLKAGKPLMMN